MAYDDIGKKATMKYIKSKQKRVELLFHKEQFETIIEPAIAESGLPTATYIKQAIMEKIERDKAKK